MKKLNSRPQRAIWRAEANIVRRYEHVLRWELPGFNGQYAVRKGRGNRLWGKRKDNSKTKMEDKAIEQNARNMNHLNNETTNVQEKNTSVAIRLPVGFFDCDKIRILCGQKGGANTIFLHLNLIDIAAKSNRKGELFIADGIPYDAEMIASLTRCDAATVKNALEMLEKYGMIRYENEAYSIVGYSKLVDYSKPRRRKNR